MKFLSHNLIYIVLELDQYIKKLKPHYLIIRIIILNFENYYLFFGFFSYFNLKISIFKICYNKILSLF